MDVCIFRQGEARFEVRYRDLVALVNRRAESNIANADIAEIDMCRQAAVENASFGIRLPTEYFELRLRELVDDNTVSDDRQSVEEELVARRIEFDVQSRSAL